MEPISGRTVWDVVQHKDGPRVDEVARIKLYSDCTVEGLLPPKLEVQGKYDKNLKRVRSLPFFRCQMSSQFDARQWLGYLTARQKAAVVELDGGTRLYLYPMDKYLYCYYELGDGAAEENEINYVPEAPAAPAALPARLASSPFAVGAMDPFAAAAKNPFAAAANDPFGAAGGGGGGSSSGWGAATPAGNAALSNGHGEAGAASKPAEVSLFASVDPFGGANFQEQKSATFAAEGSSLGSFGDQELAALHYNRLERNEEDQADSWIYHMRRFNNWVKSVLISSAKKSSKDARGLQVLDLACGKGGDVGKWVKHDKWGPGSKYVGIDIARNSLNDAVERFQRAAKTPGVTLRLAHADLGRESLTEEAGLETWEASRGWQKGAALSADEVFDVASMQFAIHYMAESPERMRRLLDTVSRHLRLGGSFIATTVDPRVLVSELLGSAKPATMELEDPETGAKRQLSVLSVTVEDSATKHNVLTVAFDPDLRERLLRPPPVSDAATEAAARSRLELERQRSLAREAQDTAEAARAKTTAALEAAESARVKALNAAGAAEAARTNAVKVAAAAAAAAGLGNPPAEAAAQAAVATAAAQAAAAAAAAEAATSAMVPAGETARQAWAQAAAADAAAAAEVANLAAAKERWRTEGGEQDESLKRGIKRDSNGTAVGVAGYSSGGDHMNGGSGGSGGGNGKDTEKAGEVLPWGVRYWFTLREEGQAAVDAPEWLLPLRLLSEMALECGLELQWPSSTNFHDFFEKHVKEEKPRALLDQLNVLNMHGSISETEWQIVHVYMCLVFVKTVARPDDAVNATVDAAAAAMSAPESRAGGAKANVNGTGGAAGAFAGGGFGGFNGGGSGQPLSPPEAPPRSPTEAPPRSPADAPPTPSPPLPLGTPSPLSVGPRTPPQPPPSSEHWGPRSPQVYGGGDDGPHAPPRFCPRTPDHPPPDWQGLPPPPPPEGPEGVYAPHSPDHPPPGWQGGGGGSGGSGGGSGGGGGSSSRRGDESDSSDEEEDLGAKAMPRVKAAVGAAWDGMSRGEKQRLIDAEVERMKLEM